MFRKIRIAAVIIILAAVAAFAAAQAEEMDCWVMCQPGDYVNARRAPSTRSESIARLECGDPIEVNGESRKGFLYCPDMPNEYGEGWVYSGYVATEQPQNACGAKYTIRSNGRVACRKCIEGDRRCWVVDGSEVRVWGYTSEWAVTNKGFVKTEYIEGLGESR